MSDDEEYFTNCKVCDKGFRSPQEYKQHQKSKKHLMKEQKERHREAMGDQSNDSDDSNNIYCEVCNSNFSGEIPYNQHLKGRNHIKNLRLRKVLGDMAENNPEGLENIIPKDEAAFLPQAYAECKKCNKKFSGLEAYQQHLKSLNHKKKEIEIKVLKHDKVKSPPETSATSNEQSLEELSSDLNFLASITDDNPLAFYCEECKKSFSGPIPFGQHVISLDHKTKPQQKIKIEEEIQTLEKDVDVKHEDDGYVLSCKVCNMAFSGPASLRDHLKSKHHRKAIKFFNFKKKMKESGKDVIPEMSNRKLPEEEKHPVQVPYVQKSEEEKHPVQVPYVQKPEEEKQPVQVPYVQKPEEIHQLSDPISTYELSNENTSKNANDSEEKTASIGIQATKERSNTKTAIEALKFAYELK